MNNQNQNKDLIVIFTNEADSKLLEIEEDYNLKDNDINWTNNEKIIVDSVRNFVLQKISEKELSDYLEKNLKTQNQKVKELAKDIIKELVPLLEILTEEQRQQKVIEMRNKNIESEKKEAEVVIKLKSPIGVLNSLKQEIQKEEIGIIPESESEPKATLPFEKEDPIKSTMPQPKTQTQNIEPEEAPTQKSKADSYREPVE